MRILCCVSRPLQRSYIAQHLLIHTAADTADASDHVGAAQALQQDIQKIDLGTGSTLEAPAS